MNVPYKKIVRHVDLGEYAEEYRGVLVYVWVNPPRDTMQRYFDLVQENNAAQEATRKLQAAIEADTPPTLAEVERAAVDAQRIGRAFLEWWAEIFSQHANEETHWTVEGLAELMTSETDPALYRFLTTSARDLQIEHRVNGKKKLTPLFLTSPAPGRLPTQLSKIQ